ncbi:MAG: carboxypeptidase-like regulatory domain-containing protein [Acidobacteriota bacterium]|nr:carboxypeptidase-like regulatory domain-containing protein [Acidobacteriota bacterium]
MKPSLIAGAVVLATIFGVAGAAQSAPRTGKSTLSGVVLDADGKPVAGAVITYQSGGGHTAHAVRSDAHGRFTIAKLRWDNYDLRASTHGQFSDWEKNVMVRSGQQKSVTLRLTNGQEMSKTAVKGAR